MAFIPYVFPSPAALGNTINLTVNSPHGVTSKDENHNTSIGTEKSGQKIPKETIYKQAKPTSDVKRIFIQQVDQIIWRYKLSPDTLNIAINDKISEIQVFDIILKQECDAINEQVLSTLDKTIPSSIYFRVFYTNTHRMKMQCAMADKRINKRDEEQMVVRDYFLGPKVDVEFNQSLYLPYLTETKSLPVVIDMAGLHKALLQGLLDEPALHDETLEQQLNRIAKLQTLQTKLTKTQATIRKEKQFNRKVELNKTLNQVKQKIKELGQ